MSRLSETYSSLVNVWVWWWIHKSETWGIQYCIFRSYEKLCRLTYLRRTKLLEASKLLILVPFITFSTNRVSTLSVGPCSDRSAEYGMQQQWRMSCKNGVWLDVSVRDDLGIGVGWSRKCQRLIARVMCPGASPCRNWTTSHFIRAFAPAPVAFKRQRFEIWSENLDSS